MFDFKCYLCGNDSYKQRQGYTRDNEHLVPLECTKCGLVQLSSFDHISQCFYEDAHMHDNLPVPSEAVLQRTQEDTNRRLAQFQSDLTGRRLLDVGCGRGDFLLAARPFAASVCGVEPERRLAQLFKKQKLTVYPYLEDISKYNKFDIITLFHVLEHSKNPVGMLSLLCDFIENKNGICIVEVPNANDILLSVYRNKNFSKFVYWSCHLFLFTEETLRQCAEKAGLKTIRVMQCQRYPLTNHLYWLAEGKPGGQDVYTSLTDNELNMAYAKVLAKNKLCDTIIGVFTV